MEFKITKLKEGRAKYEVIQFLPEEGRNIVFYIEDLDEFKQKLGDDEMTLTGFNRARRILAERGDQPKEEEKPNLVQQEMLKKYAGKKEEGKKPEEYERTVKSPAKKGKIPATKVKKAVKNVKAKK